MLKGLRNTWGDTMKRLLIDAIFIFVLVSLGSSLQNHSADDIKEDLHDQLQSFEEDVAMHREIRTPKDTVKLNDITENKASAFAREASGLVIDVLDTSVSAVSEIFHGLLE